MNEIKNIIFDLGGVLLDIDFNRTFDAFEKLGFRGAGECFKRPDVNRLCLDFEIGAYCPEELRSRFREITGFDCSDDEFDEAWNALLGDFPPDRIRRVQELAGRYKTYLLSNTNPIHCKHFNNELKKNFGIESFDHLLDKAWYSHKLGLRKPHEQIFRKVLELSGLSHEETLYIDDFEVNVKTAESVGMTGLLVTPEFTIIEALKDY
jgi:putative hydrolase of the HAD superfamily